ncbi:MAG: periplasmic heavy metal sensor [Limisphaerales bacterium]
MKLPTVSRPLFAALCGFTLAALPDASRAQERAREERPRENAPRDERPADGQRPPRGDFRPGEAQRGEPQRDGGVRRDDAGRGPARRVEGQRGDSRPGEGQRGQPGQPGGQPGQQFNPQELFRDLNDDQRNALRGFFEAQQGVMREVGERSMRLRREITEATMADKPNEGLIREKIMQAAQLEAESTIARTRAFSQVREKLPKETVERLRSMMANSGPRSGMQGPMQGGPGGQGGQREGGDVRRPAGDNFNQPGRGTPDGQFRRPDAQREGDQLRKPAGEGDRRPAEGDFRRPAGPRDGDQIRKPGEGDRGPRPDGDRGPRPDGDRGVRPDGDRGRNPEGGDRKPELPRRPPADQ